MSLPFNQALSYLTDYNPDWLYVFGLNVHHKYYQEQLAPWEYPDDALITYCKICHQNLHEVITIPWLDKFGNEIGKITPCSRCGGTGNIPKFWYVQNGICFQCMGKCYKELK